MICTSISVNVEVTHRSTASNEEITFALLTQATLLSTLINAEDYTIEYVGNRAVETNAEIILSNVPPREMGESEREFFENVAFTFLNDRVSNSFAGQWNADADGDLRFLSVTVNGQEFSTIDDTGNPIEGNYVPTLGSDSQRRLSNLNDIQVSVKGYYRPPPEIDFGKVVEDSINSDRELFTEKLNNPPPMYLDGSGASMTAPHLDYFDETQVVGAREIKDEKEGIEEKPLLTAGMATVQNSKDDGTKNLLNMAAMIVGAMIFVLSSAFLLRPHRRSAIFSTKSKDTQPQAKSQPVDVESRNLLKPSRHMFDSYRKPSRGFGSSFTSSDCVDSSMRSNRGSHTSSRRGHSEIGNSHRSGTSRGSGIGDPFRSASQPATLDFSNSERQHERQAMTQSFHSAYNVNRPVSNEGALHQSLPPVNTGRSYGQGSNISMLSRSAPRGHHRRGPVHSSMPPSVEAYSRIKLAQEIRRQQNMARWDNGEERHQNRSIRDIRQALDNL